MRSTWPDGRRDESYNLWVSGSLSTDKIAYTTVVTVVYSCGRPLFYSFNLYIYIYLVSSHVTLTKYMQHSFSIILLFVAFILLLDGFNSFITYQFLYYHESIIIILYLLCYVLIFCLVCILPYCFMHVYIKSSSHLHRIFPLPCISTI